MPEDNEFTTIQITKGTRDRLKKLRLIEREPYDDEINRLLDELVKLRKVQS